MKTRKVSESVAEHFKLDELNKVSRVGSDEPDASSVTEEQFKLEQKIQERVAGQ